MSGTTATVGGHELSFTCHGGLLAGKGPPQNSLDGIRRCLDAGAARIEIDIHSIADADYLVSHANRLEESTTSRGSVGSLTRNQALQLHRKDDLKSRPPLLSEVVELALPYASEFQLDLKDWRPLSRDRVAALISVVEPLTRRVIVSSGQDWNLRAIAAQSSALRLGLDPDHYVAPRRCRGRLPTRHGAYGYRDDHPLAVGRVQSVADYLGGRMNDLTGQCPFAHEFFINYRLLLQALDDGVSIPQLLGDRGIAVNAWTLDHGGSKSLTQLERLAAAGVERITTNTTEQFLAALSA